MANIHLYQPRLKDHLIRKLYRVAKRNGIPMTYVVNAILEANLIKEEEPQYEERWNGEQKNLHEAALKRRT